MKDWTVYIFNSIAYENKDEGWRKERNIMSLRMSSPVPYTVDKILRAGWLLTRMNIFKAILVPSEQFVKQIDDDSCGVFCLSFMDSIIRGLVIFSQITQAFIDKLKKDYAFEIFLKNTNLAETMESE